jgi:hypothetical protein
MAARLNIPRNEYIILAAVVVGVFPLTYIITTYLMRLQDKKQGYPRTMKGDRISL